MVDATGHSALWAVERCDPVFREGLLGPMVLLFLRGRALLRSLLQLSVGFAGIF